MKDALRLFAPLGRVALASCDTSMVTRVCCMAPCAPSALRVVAWPTVESVTCVRGVGEMRERRRDHRGCCAVWTPSTHMTAHEGAMQVGTVSFIAAASVGGVSAGTLVGAPAGALAGGSTAAAGDVTATGA